MSDFPLLRSELAPLADEVVVDVGNICNNNSYQAAASLLASHLK